MSLLASDCPTGSGSGVASSKNQRLGLLLLGALVIAFVVFLNYRPLWNNLFFAEDHSFLGDAARLSFPDALARYFGLDFTVTFYRPIQRMLEWFEVWLFGNTASGYRVVQTLVHLGNCLLLFGILRYQSNKWQMALVAALFFAILPAIDSTFFWVTASDQLVSLFYLLTLAVWLRYLYTKNDRLWWLSVFCALLALLSKEVAATLPVALFLADRWLVREPARWKDLARRYAPFVGVWLVYGLYYIPKVNAFRSGVYSGPYAGLGFGSNIISNLGYYLTALIFPWNVQDSANLAWIGIAAAAALYLVAIRRHWSVAFLCVTMVMPLLPVLMFTFTTGRYMYLPMVGSVVFFSLLFYRVMSALARWRWAIPLGAACIAIIVAANAIVNAETFDGMSGFTRELRTPFRPIFQKHPTFGNGSYLYLVNSPVSDDIVAGMFTLRYGTGISVSGTGIHEVADLGSHAGGYVFSFDEQKKVTETRVTPATGIGSQPQLPLEFDFPVRLDKFEVVSTELSRGQAIIVLLYWRATGGIDKDYSLFAHLKNPTGELVTGSDSQPRAGRLPTHFWKAGDLVVDWVVVPVTDQVPTGQGYSLELGWYYLPTMEHRQIVDAGGQPVSDHFTIGPFGIIEN